jgi:acetyl esterase/lipase
MGLLVVIGLCVVFIGVAIFKPLWIMNYLAPRFHSSRIKDLSYAQDDRHTLDIYMPKHKKSDDIIVFIHGGAWDTGNKNEYQFAGLAFNELGYITVVPNYRLYPQVQFPHFIEDIAKAIASVPSHLSNLNHHQQTPPNIILIGHSAGAHTAAMLATQPSYLENAKANVHLKACIGLAGPYDLPLDDPLVIGKFDGVTLHDISENYIDLGHEHNAHEANPINLATVNTTKMYLIHGEADETVGPYHSERFANMLKHLQVSHEYTTYPHVNHRHLVGGLSLFGRKLNPVFRDIKAYLARLS